MRVTIAAVCVSTFGVLLLGGGVAMAIIFKGTWAVAFAILEGMLLAAGVGLLGRVVLGVPARRRAT